MRRIKKGIKYSVMKATAGVYLLQSRLMKIHWAINSAGTQELPSKLQGIKRFSRKMIKSLKLMNA
jgi:hypothetical protein